MAVASVQIPTAHCPEVGPAEPHSPSKSPSVSPSACRVMSGPERAWRRNEKAGWLTSQVGYVDHKAG